MIHEAISEVLSEPRKPYKSRRAPHLWPSSLGRCPRAAMLRVKGVTPTGEFPPTIRSVMELGVRYEDSTYSYLQSAYGGQVKQSVPLRTKIWSGKIDFLVTLPQGVYIVEHKAVGDKWWDYQQSLPKAEHICQACLYRHLYEQIHGIIPTVILYYRAWSSWAEFTLAEYEDGVRCTGKINGEEVSRWRWVSPTKLRLELEHLFETGTIPDPPNQPSVEQGCLFQGKPSCIYYGICYPQGQTPSHATST